MYSTSALFSIYTSQTSWTGSLETRRSAFLEVPSSKYICNGPPSAHRTSQCFQEHRDSEDTHSSTYSRQTSEAGSAPPPPHSLSGPLKQGRRPQRRDRVDHRAILGGGGYLPSPVRSPGARWAARGLRHPYASIKISLIRSREPDFLLTSSPLDKGRRSGGVAVGGW